MCDVVYFEDSEVVIVDDSNVAHAIVNGRMGCLLPDDFQALRSVRLSDPLTWAQTKDPRCKPWPAWPCQTCAARVTVVARRLEWDSLYAGRVAIDHLPHELLEKARALLAA